MAKKKLRLACSKRIPYLTICSCQGPRWVHLEFLTTFETNCQWSIAERSKNNAKQKHKCHVYIRSHHLAISLGAKKEGLNMLEITENYMKLTWSDMKQHEIYLPSTWKTGLLFGCPLFQLSVITPGCPQHCSKPSVVLELLHQVINANEANQMWSFKFVPSVPVLLGDSTAVKSSRVLVDQVMGSTEVLSLTRLRTLTPSKQWDHCLLQPIVQVSCSHICLPISILKRCMCGKKHEIRRYMWALFTNS